MSDRCESTKGGLRCHKAKGHNRDDRNLPYPIGPRDCDFHAAYLDVDGNQIETLDYDAIEFWLAEGATDAD